MGSALAFAGVAVIAAVIAWLPWMKGALNARMFAAQIEKLAQADNLDRALKLARVAPQAPFARATTIAIEALHGAPDDADAAAAMLRDKFRAAITADVARATRGWIPAAVAVGAIAAALALAPWDASALPPVGGLCGVAAMMLVHAYALMRRLAHDTVHAGDHMIQTLVTSRRALRSRA